MGCKCANSSEEEFEIDKKDLNKDSENIFNQNDLNNTNDNKYLNNEINENIENKNDDYQENLNQNYINNSNNSNEFNQNDYENNHNLKYLNYPERIVEIINTIRQEPSAYSYIIEDSIKNIIENNNKDDITKNKIIYKKKVKVALTRGEPAFHEAAEELRNMDPLPPLEFLPALCIPLPETEEEIKDSTYLKNQVLELRKEGIGIDVFFKDLVKIPEVSALLMIVDDNGKNAGKKRMTLLNSEFKYIGVNCKFVGKTFIAYLAFSKWNEFMSKINFIYYLIILVNLFIK